MFINTAGIEYTYHLNHNPIGHMYRYALCKHNVSCVHGCCVNSSQLIFQLLVSKNLAVGDAIITKYDGI